MTTRRLPRVVDGLLDAGGCDLEHLERELHRLGHVYALDHQASRLRPVPTRDPDEHVVAVVLGYAAAAPLWSSALAAMAELDAAVVAIGCPDFATWDAAVAGPIAGWSAQVESDVRPEEPTLGELARAAMTRQRVALRAVLAIAGDGDPAQAATRVLWEHGIGFGDLHGAVVERRQALVDLGRELDRVSASSTPVHAVALTLASRALVARALVVAASQWLEDLDVRGAAQPTRVEVQREVDRLHGVTAALKRNVTNTYEAVLAMIGMDL